MQSSRDIKRRIRSVKNIAQITKAMEVVSMTKMRKSQQFALAARPYAVASVDMLRNILTLTEKGPASVFLQERTIKTAAIVVVGTDKGLVGGFNDAVLALAEGRKKMLEAADIKVEVITIGKKIKEYFEQRGIIPAFHFDEQADTIRFHETRAMSDAILTGYREGKWDAVYIDYTHFKTTLKQESFERRLLPTSEPALEDIIEEIIPEQGRFSDVKRMKDAVHTRYNYTYTFEPRAEEMIDDLVCNLLRIAFHHVILESNASEHSTRMVTMKNASDNAGELKDRLTLEYNKIRQASITAEISEIVAGAEALQ